MRSDKMKPLQQMTLKTRRVRKGQSVVEFALGSLLVAMLLAGAVDLGRAFYTYVVVLNMSGEAATILAFYPDNDITEDTHGGGRPPGTPDNATFQRRAQQVAARSLGMIIDPAHVSDAAVVVDVDKRHRCLGAPFSVSATYTMDDLFLPALLGFNQISIGGVSGSRFTTAGSTTSSVFCP